MDFKKKRFMSTVEHEIKRYVELKGYVTSKKLMEWFNKDFIDPPNPTRVREVLFRMYMKEKLDRIRVKTIGRSSEFIYFKPDNIPDIVKSYINEEE